MADLLDIVAVTDLEQIDETLSLCDPESYYFLVGMAELNGNKARNVLDIVALSSVSADNIGSYLSKATPFVYYFLKGIQEYADAP